MKYSNKPHLNLDWAATTIAFLLVVAIGAGVVWIVNMLLDKIFGGGG